MREMALLFPYHLDELVRDIFSILPWVIFQFAARACPKLETFEREKLARTVAKSFQHSSPWSQEAGRLEY